MSQFKDPIRDGLGRGWKVLGGKLSALPEKIHCDVAIIGSAAGSGITAELLALTGLSVVIIEEGPLKGSSNFNQLESVAYKDLYQKSAGRRTKDKAISILQGRWVGGSTTVNWTSSFSTPAGTLRHWQEHFGLADYGAETLAPYFAQAQTRLGIAPWSVTPNANNAVLARGAAKLGFATEAIARNVKGCHNLGSCGLGCPTNAKQSMLVTTLPAALELGTTLLMETRAQQFIFNAGKISHLLCIAVKANAGPVKIGSIATTIVAKYYVLGGGAINSPALLMRSKAPDPHHRLGTRTFLHPATVTAAVMPTTVAGWAGAPQSVYSDHFLHSQAIDGPIGFKLESAPVHPVFVGAQLPGFGPPQTALFRQFANSQILVAMMRDGFHDQSVGGRVELNSCDQPVLDYGLTDFVMDGARRAQLAMAEIQFAAGATTVYPAHEMGAHFGSWAEAKKAISDLPMQPLLTKIGSAHVMGGCGLSAQEHLGVTRPDGVHWQIDNLSIHDGSLFPTSIGANPQLSIYGMVNRLAQALAKRLTGKDIVLALIASAGSCGAGCCLSGSSGGKALPARGHRSENTPNCRPVHAPP
jgi:choline dehydrogenase-like flavoprotein